jgi:hypothetical protein
MNTDALMCMAFTKQMPSATPLFPTSSSTVDVIFTNPRRDGTLNQRYSVSDFTPDFYQTFSRMESCGSVAADGVVKRGQTLEIEG